MINSEEYVARQCDNAVAEFFQECNNTIAIIMGENNNGTSVEGNFFIKVDNEGNPA